MSDSNDPARTDTISSDGPESKHEEESTDRSDRAGRSDASDQDHLRGVEDGCGCAEVWEHLSEQRERNREAAAPATGED